MELKFSNNLKQYLQLTKSLLHYMKFIHFYLWTKLKQKFIQGKKMHALMKDQLSFFDWKLWY